MLSTKQAIFHLGEEEYSLDIMDVIAIEKVMAIESVSSLSQNFRGVISLRGDIIPVYSLRRKFNFEDVEPNTDTRFVVTNTNGVLVAYEVDKMAGIVQLSQDQLNDVPVIIKVGNSSSVKAITKVNDRLVIILDKDQILTTEEINQVKAVINNKNKE